MVLWEALDTFVRGFGRSDGRSSFAIYELMRIGIWQDREQIKAIHFQPEAVV